MFSDRRSRVDGFVVRAGGLAALAALVALVLGTVAGDAGAAQSADRRVDRLGEQLQELSQEVRTLKQELARERERRLQEDRRIVELAEEVERVKEAPLFDPSLWINRFELGGYGEIHGNFGESSSRDQIDIHRLVLNLGYDFNEWIKFHSETEVEHAFVSDGDGDLVIEQAYVDFLLSERVNVRAGRVLTPLGIVNKYHEPTTFNGVERPSFAKFVIPTTWSSDGVGLFGSLSEALSYEAYVVGGLDGSQFNALEGIRDGRIKERPSFNDPALTGRVDWRPLSGSELAARHRLRLGFSGYYGGVDNGDQGKDPGVDGDIQIYSADFEYSVSDFDFRGAAAKIFIDGARGLGSGTASEIVGWYLDAGYHFWPEAWKKGKLDESDAVAFVRYDDFDTQQEVPSGVQANPAGDRQEWTLGVNFFLTPQFVVKADYQFKDSEASGEPDDQFNVGIGWTF